MLVPKIDIIKELAIFMILITPSINNQRSVVIESSPIPTLAAELAAIGVVWQKILKTTDSG